MNHNKKSRITYSIATSYAGEIGLHIGNFHSIHYVMINLRSHYDHDPYDTLYIILDSVIISKVCLDSTE